MQTVVETPTFIARSKICGLSTGEITEIIDLVATDPMIGEVIAGTGGCRKFRFARRGGGKSGGYRVVHFFSGVDIPIFLITIYAKNEKDNLSKDERNMLGEATKRLVQQYQVRGR